jgi:predicted nucleic acid-binding protein
MLRFLDTNILLYYISRDPIETTKRERAVALIDEGNNALSVQVLQEFYVQATRATRPNPLPHDIAVGFMRSCASRCRRSLCRS